MRERKGKERHVIYVHKSSCKKEGKKNLSKDNGRLKGKVEESDTD